MTNFIYQMTYLLFPYFNQTKERFKWYRWCGIYYLLPIERVAETSDITMSYFVLILLNRDTIWLATTGGALLYITEPDLAVQEMAANADVVL